ASSSPAVAVFSGSAAGLRSCGEGAGTAGRLVIADLPGNDTANRDRQGGGQPCSASEAGTVCSHLLNSTGLRVCRERPQRPRLPANAECCPIGCGFRRTRLALWGRRESAKEGGYPPRRIGYKGSPGRFFLDQPEASARAALADASGWY